MDEKSQFRQLAVELQELVNLPLDNEGEYITAEKTANIIKSRLSSEYESIANHLPYFIYEYIDGVGERLVSQKAREKQNRRIKKMISTLKHGKIPKSSWFHYSSEADGVMGFLEYLLIGAFLFYYFIGFLAKLIHDWL